MACPGAAMDSTSAWARVSSARGTSTCLNSFEAWTLPTTIRSSRTAWQTRRSRPWSLILTVRCSSGTSCGDEQDRVRLAGDAGAEAQRVVPLEDAAEPPRHGRALRDRAADGHPAPLVELGERPEGQLLQADDVGRVARDQLDHLLGGARAAPAARCGRGRGSSSGSARAPAHGTSLRTPCASSSPTPRVHAAVRPRARRGARSRRARRSSWSRRASASAPSPRRTATGGGSSSIRSRRGSSAARACACR